MLTRLISRSPLVVLGLAAATWPIAWAGCGTYTAQTNTGASQIAAGGPVACVITNIYGLGGLKIPNPTLPASFQNAFQTSSLANLTPLSAAIGTQLSLLPLASSASGFTYTFDPASGAYTRSSETYGPILAERAETIGRKKFLFAFSYQRYEFNTIDNLDVRNFPAVQSQTIDTTFPPSNDVIATRTGADLKINQSTLFATYGAADWLDVSVAMPVENVSLTATSKATIIRIANSTANFFDPADVKNSLQKTFMNSSSASGIGDVTLRAKGTVWKNDTIALAVAVDLRLPTGDASNYLGSGAIGFKPFVIASLRKGRVSPHVNVGYQKNGSSILAGDVNTNVKASLPDQFIWTVGADGRVLKRVTLALDILGQRVFDAPRLVATTFTTTPVTSANPLVSGSLNLPNVKNITQSYNAINGSAGVKVNLGGNFLATANLLVKLNDGGLRANLSPLFGVSYTF
jgi:Putative MetA-pathway of phenol degradation